MAYPKLKVKIKLTTDMLGTVAKDPEIYKNFIESKKSIDFTLARSPSTIMGTPEPWAPSHCSGRLFALVPATGALPETRP